MAGMLQKHFLIRINDYNVVGPKANLLPPIANLMDDYLLIGEIRP